MLKGIDPRLSAELLYVLRAMGHGDMLIVADANFPAAAVAKQTVHGELLRMDGATAPEAIGAILSVMPLDTFVEDAAARMEVVGDAAAMPIVQQEALAKVKLAAGADRALIPVERFAFYELSEQAYAVVQTGERRFYGCFMLRKGVIGPEE
ncbi:RbsD/FucU family protein [Sedimentitalea sp. XS_ASV28]|uniref:RbsD/FucU family protein n=1 Tax=Sedimentitalea sp. XS_ASV28 TaxID=3241296 RepID=UPI003519D186